MLVISRTNKERIILDESIYIEIIRLEAKKVRLGISAPESVLVRREELPLRGEQFQQLHTRNMLVRKWVNGTLTEDETQTLLALVIPNYIQRDHNRSP
jgi:carbon storage regulator CsrA